MTKRRTAHNYDMALPDIQRACVEKVFYPHKNNARDAAARRKRTPPLRPYKCLHCTGWHLTSRIPEENSAIRSALRRRATR